MDAGVTPFSLRRRRASPPPRVGPALALLLGASLAACGASGGAARSPDPDPEPAAQDAGGAPRRPGRDAAVSAGRDAAGSVGRDGAVPAGPDAAALPATDAAAAAGDAGARADTAPPPGGDGAAPAARLGLASVNPAAAGVPIAPDFAALSYEWVANGYPFGTPTQPNKVLARLLANLPPSVIRVGGNSTDEACYEGLPAPLPAGCKQTITAATVRTVAGFAAAAGWRLVLGVNLGQNDPAFALAGVKALLLPNVPAALLAGLEIGNEPDLFPEHAWYEEAGKEVNVRATGYKASAAAAEWSAVADALRGDPTSKSIPLHGPGYCCSWKPTELDAFARAAGPTRLDVFTTHVYPLNVCTPEAAARVTIPRMLDDATTKAALDRFEIGSAAAAAIGRPHVLGEVNSVACGGQEKVSDVAASALWGLDFLFGAAAKGVQRVHFHGGGSSYSPIITKSGKNRAMPLYYALAMFGKAQGGTLIPVTLTSAARVKAYGVTGACDGCVARVFLVNKDLAAAGTITVKSATPARRAAIVTLAAAALDAPGVTLGGAVVDEATGALPEPAVVRLDPGADGTFEVPVPHAGAVMVTLER